MRLFLLHKQLKPKPVWDFISLLHCKANANANTNMYFYSSLLRDSTDIKSVRQLHAHLLAAGLEHDIFLGTKLVNVYVQCGSLDRARLVFDRIDKRNIYLWAAIIRGYAVNGPYEESLTLYYEMQRAAIRPNNFAFSFVLKACAHLSALQEGRKIHYHIVRTGFEANAFVGTALVDMYAKCGSIEDARQVFDKMVDRDVVSWNAMIAGYAQNGHANEALNLFYEMQLDDVKPDSVTVASALQACAHMGALQQGKLIHGSISRGAFKADVFVRTALIDMYSKCGQIEIARQVFDRMSERDAVSWSAMISGYGMHGHVNDVLALFSQMQQTGMKPDHVTFVCVLSACSHAGLVDEGWQYFSCMSRNYHVTPRMEHYVCMVDLLGRAGRLDEAQDFIQRMPLEPDADVWGALLGACRIHRNIDLGERMADRLFDLKPEKPGSYVLLSNIYAAAGKWDDVAKVRLMMKSTGVKKTPGCSFIEVDSSVHSFLVGDRSHPQSERIYAALEALGAQMEEAGYIPDTNFELHDVEDKVKERTLYSHSEKLAITFGLISTSPGTPIQITKNLRVCGDCHSATKFISKIVRRKIIVRDANRFHHFEDGSCSCGDYW